MSIVADYTALCASREAIHAAETLPERFHAVMQYHGDLARFVQTHPRVLALGVDALARAEAEAEVLS